MIDTFAGNRTTTESRHLISPHGGELVNLIASAERAAELKSVSQRWPSWDLTARQICDLELLLTGGFSPLRGFLNRADYESCCANARLSNGELWPIPITLDVTEEFVKSIPAGGSVALRDAEGVMLAALHIEEVWQPDREQEAQAVFGTTSLSHPGVEYLLRRTNPCYVSGTLEGIRPPAHYDFRTLRLTPAELRHEFANLGWRKIVAFQTRNPMHRAHFELTLRAAKEAEASVLIHPSVGMTRPGDVEYYVRVRCYQALLSRYPRGTVKLALLPLAMRMGGPREALWHAIIRKNHGCSHFIVGRDHAGPGSDADGTPFYGPYAAQELVKAHEAELGVKLVPFRNMIYLQDEDQFAPEDEIPQGARTLNLSGTELRRRLSEGRDIPGWFTFPEVAHELQRAYPPRQRQGFTLFFTGLSGSGKSTIANILRVKFLEMGGRPVTLLDGDLVRKHLSSELGFSKEHRDINIRRIGFVASEITKNGGIAICAPIAPYESVRKEVQAMIEPHGAFLLVYLKPPLEVCESRDRKGLYAKARAGILQQFTGISDPYEEPANADVAIDTSQLTPEESAQQIFLHLEAQGLIGANSQENAA
ncbi:MAG: bifunctional sulfate adenylyltransferase/adenylylsulfate kinase [Acidobacteriaceae bacterium]|nr:bifunctional sulfate adenylyltransferase/adenylylsulfate kinase [Acidobacteriaceae bacterium]MBV9765662.1 bifunctional sulfate adenylyltransferase/adenylylsulfate kinase [Acidobacteriaceae bacterium]